MDNVLKVSLGYFYVHMGLSIVISALKSRSMDPSIVITRYRTWIGVDSTLRTIICLLGSVGGFIVTFATDFSLSEPDGLVYATVFAAFLPSCVIETVTAFRKRKSSETLEALRVFLLVMGFLEECVVFHIYGSDKGPIEQWLNRVLVFIILLCVGACALDLSGQYTYMTRFWLGTMVTLQGFWILMQALILGMSILQSLGLRNHPSSWMALIAGWTVVGSVFVVCAVTLLVNRSMKVQENSARRQQLLSEYA